MSSADPVTYSEDVQSLLTTLSSRPFPAMKNETTLKAAKGVRVDNIPTWLHRQAGRYLPRFQAVRKQHGFFDVCRTPTLAAEVTLEPIDTFPHLDASIIFSDILVIPQALGIDVEMQDKVGPVVPHPIRTPADLDRVLFKFDVNKSLQYVYDAILVTRHGLDGRVPLIGFCGAPWTLFAYMCEGKSSKTYEESKKFLYLYPEAGHKLMQCITDACVEFLIGQAKAGAQMLQVFESSGGELSWDMFQEFALPYLLQIPARVKAALREANVTSAITVHNTLDGKYCDNDDIPISCFPRMASQALPYLACGQYDVFSLDHTVNPQLARQLVQVYRYTDVPQHENCKNMERWFKPGLALDKTTKVVTVVDTAVVHTVTLQGNIDPYLLFAEHHVIQDRTENVLRQFGMDQFICNLGHGMLPNHDPEAVRTLTTSVKRISQAMHAERQ